MRVEFGEYRLDTEARTLQREGRRIPIQSKAFDLLAYLIERRERVVSSDELLDALWPGLHVTPAALSTAVQKARQAVGDDGEHQAVLQTEHGKGFRFVAEVTDFSSPEARPSGSTGKIKTPLFDELKRRNVFRVAVAYGIVSWLLVEVASVVVPALRLPEWTLTLLVFLVIAGFPLALILAWAFELTPEGIKREAAVDPAESITAQTGRRLDFAIIALLAVALVFLVVDHYVLEGEPKPPPARGRSIAVLPFANRSANEEDAFFVDGMHDDIVTHLSKIRALKVVSRTSVMEYRNTTKNMKTIGQELGVTTVLEGGVQRVGNQIRVGVQLIDAETDDHLWADIYDRQLTTANFFAIQTEIATAIADALQANVSAEERGLIDTVPTKNMAALEAYFRGKQNMAKRSSAALAEAVEDFNRAIELDPSFALAYIGLADSYSLQTHYSDVLENETLAKAQAATERAMALSDRLAEAYASLGFLEFSRGNYEASEAAFRRALDLNPNYATACQWYSTLLEDALGRQDEALALIKKAAELDPRSPIVLLNVGIRYAAVGQFEESLAWLNKANEIDPGFASAYLWIGFYHWAAKGRLDEAVRWIQTSVSVDPANPRLTASLGWLFLDLGDPDRAAFWIERSLKLSPENFFPNLAMQLLYLYRGDSSVALEYGQKAFATEMTVWPTLYREFEPVRVQEMRAGRYLEARAAFEKIAPELLNDNYPKIQSKNYRAAIDLALILSKTGEQKRSDRLLEHSRQYIQRVPRLGDRGYDIADVQIYVLQGDKEKALSALQQAIDEGWRGSWWYYLNYDPILESLHEKPEYQAMVAEIEADMATQLAHVREMERNGELEPIAEVLGATQ